MSTSTNRAATKATSANRATKTSATKAAANRRNSKLSTGPKTPNGKARCSLNAVKTGLTGRTVLLPSEDAEAYRDHLARFTAEHDPSTGAEKDLVQSLADTEWRLLRIPTLEMGIYAKGRLEFAALFADQAPAVRPALLDAHIYLTYYRQLSNLTLQEARLRRQRDRDLATLEQLKEASAQASAADRSLRLRNIALRCMRAHHDNQPFSLADFGSEFTMDEVERVMDRMSGMRKSADHPGWQVYDVA